MNEWEPGGNVSGTLMRDMAFSIAFVFIILFVFLAPFINVPRNQAAEVKMPGNLMIWIKWPDYVDVDVDLWARAPGDVAVGYSNRAGKTFNLLRDDLGATKDSTPLNYEVIFGRDMPDGLYTINVHLYRNASEFISVQVDADVFVSHGSQAVSIAKRRVDLTHVGHEITIANFTLANGKVVGIPDHVYVPLRTSPSPGGGAQ